MIKIRRQRPISGGRDPLSSCVEKRILTEATRVAARLGVSRSFFVSTVMADALGIDLDAEDRYDYSPRKFKKAG